ncbi:MAG TPA: hypothetical protein VK589_09040 [Chryseolinea sp.]|nr:hypothetical protein [Chryseolinea sp.]
MRNNLSVIGRVFFGVAIAGMGLLTIYYRDFPYMLIPPKHSWIPGLAPIAYLIGALLVLAGACIVFEKKIRLVSLLLGSVLLLIFCFYFIPFGLVSSNYKSFSDWENAAKELTLCSGALIIAGTVSEKNEHSFITFLSKLIPLGVIFFSITIISYGVNHFLYAKDVADYVPSWVPFHLFWTYLGGAALIGSGLAIMLKIKPTLAATLLGAMIISWFIILHIPRIIVSPLAYMGSEIASALLALAYSGIAFVTARRRP